MRARLHVADTPYRLDPSKRLAANNRRHPVHYPALQSGLQRLAIKVVKDRN
jgi:hypothetical protein